MKLLLLVFLLIFSHIIASNASHLDVQEHNDQKETVELSEDEISKISTRRSYGFSSSSSRSYGGSSSSSRSYGGSSSSRSYGGSSSSSRSYGGSSSSSRSYGGSSSSRSYRGGSSSSSSSRGYRGRSGGLYGAAGGGALGAAAGQDDDAYDDYQQGSATPTAQLELTLTKLLIILGIYVIQF